MTEDLTVLILAAGKGTRMKSDLVKVLHPLMGRPLLAHVVNSARYLNPVRIVAVVGHQADAVQAACRDMGLTFCHQMEQLGTGHAVASARQALEGFEGTVLILSGDVPLLSPQTMSDFLAAHHEIGVPLSVLTVDLVHPGSYGRVIRDEEGYLLRIVEARDASPEERAVTEINTGIYAVDAGLLFEAVGSLKPDNDQKEYYLTDVASYAREQGHLVAAVMCPDPEEVLGINDRGELALATAILRTKINRSWMAAGVTMIDPETTYIETTVKLDKDVTLWPGAMLLGRTTVRQGAVIGAGCHLTDVSVGAGSIIKSGSVIEQHDIPEGTVIDPLTVIGPES